MKILLGVILFTLFTINTTAQNSLGKTDDLARIVLNSYISPQAEGVPSIAKRHLINKLNQIASKNGMGGSAYNPRFIITPNISVLTKDITPTAPPMTALTLEVTFYIGDGIEGTLFTSESIEVKGVGRSETKAYVSAIKQIKPTHPTFKNLVNKGKTKIIEYYNVKCDFIIKEALTKANRKEFEEAISSLLAVPEVCKECYDKCQDHAVTVYKKKMENECMEKIQQATIAKANNNWDEAASLLTGILPDVSCFNDAQTILKEVEDHRCSVALGKANGAWSAMNSRDAGYWISQVSADSKCYKDALALGNTIKAKLKKDEDKEWSFKLKQQQDNVDLKKQAIKAVRDVGVAYGRNQKATVYKSLF